MQADWSAASQSFSRALFDPGGAPNILSGFDAKRFAVYRNNVHVGLINALIANFPAVVRLVGTDFFHAMARDFIALHPPASRLMFEYGKELPEFMAGAPQLAAFPYLHDVAQLELMWLESFHEMDAPVVAPDDLARLAPDQLDQLKFKCHPATRMFKSTYAAGSIFLSNRQGQQPDEALDPTVAECVLITRPALDVQMHVIGSGNFEFIHLLGSGQCLSSAAHVALDVDPKFDLSIGLNILLVTGAFTFLETGI